jgi:CRP/FNR family transcriptional regulator, cyclic AMP receptor protein
MEVHDEKYRLLQESKIFNQLDIIDLEKLAQSSEIIDFDTSQIILQEGSIPKGFYLIMQGRALVYTRNNQAGQKLVIAEVKKHDILGELSVIDSLDISATAQALEPTQCLYMTQDVFLKALNDNHVIARNLLTILISRMRKMYHLVNHT